MEPEGLLPCSKKPTVCPHLESGQFKSLLHGQEGCVFFSANLNVRKYQYVLVRLGRQAAFKSSTLYCVRAGKGLMAFVLAAILSFLTPCVQILGYHKMRWVLYQTFFHECCYNSELIFL
jgi:hypothetical protein